MQGFLGVKLDLHPDSNGDFRGESGGFLTKLSANDFLQSDLENT